MIYRDPPFRSSHLLWFALLALLFYGWNFWVPELRNHEAVIGVAAREALQNGSFLPLTYTGEPVNLAPLTVWLSALLGWCFDANLNEEATVRLPAVLAALGMAFLSWRLARRLVGTTAAWTAAALTLGTLATWRLSQTAGSDTLFAAFIAAAWFTWLRRGKQERHWRTAWALCLLYVFLAALAGGAIRALLFFYLPLMVQRAHFRAWRRMLTVGHAIALATAAAALLALMAAGQPMPGLETLATDSFQESYLRHLLLFPVKALIYLLPTLLVAWCGYCSWFRSLEQDPDLQLACSYLRRIVLSLTLLAWLWPSSSPRMLLALLPPLAVLSSCHFNTLLQRFPAFFLQIEAWAGKVTLWACLALTAGLMPLLLSGVVFLPGFAVVQSGIPMVVGGTLLLAFLLQWPRRRLAWPAWLRWFATLALPGILYGIMAVPLYSWFRNEHRDFGVMVFRKGTVRTVETAPAILSDQEREEAEKFAKVPSDALVLTEADAFNLTTPLAGEIFYRDRRVRKVPTLDTALAAGLGAYPSPGPKASFYVLTNGLKPNVIDYDWEAISPVALVERVNVLAWEILLDHQQRFDASAFPWTLLLVERREGSLTFTPEYRGRMYRGQLRPPEERPTLENSNVGREP